MKLKDYVQRLQIELGSAYQVMETNEEKLLIWQQSILVADLTWSAHVPMALKCAMASNRVNRIVEEIYSLEEDNLVEIARRMKINLDFERNVSA